MSERGTYLGVPLLAIVCLFAWRWRRSAVGRFLVVGFVLAVVGSLGRRLTFDGHRLAILPWAQLAARPLFRNVMPVRLMVYAALAAAVMTALWAASSARPRWLRIALPCLAALAIIPNLAWAGWERSPQVPQLFTSSLYRSCLGRDEDVLLLPFGTRGDTMIWQARTGFWFEDAGGYISPYPPASYTTLQGMFRVASEDNPARGLDRRRAPARAPETRDRDRGRRERGIALVAGAEPVRTSPERRRRTDLSPPGRPASRGEMRRRRQTYRLTPRGQRQSTRDALLRRDRRHGSHAPALSVVSGLTT